MSKTGMNRRQFMDTAGRTVAGTALVLSGTSMAAGAAAAARSVDNRVAETLLRMTRLLFPHESISNAVYGEIVASLDKRAGDSADFKSLLEDGVAALDRARADTWLKLDPDDQVAVLGEQEGTAFFKEMRTATVRQLYRHRELWKLGGYEGSSVEYGGYLNRGFDDIDWLPEA